MPASSKSDSLKTQKLDEDSFVAFDHAAAGHDGVRCHSSGSLIAKPCTEEEVTFYESSALHPEFVKYMPTFIGTLASASQENMQLPIPGDLGSVSITSVPSSGTDTPVTPEVAQKTEVVTITKPIDKEETTYVPSGGKKLETGISIVLENVAAGFTRPNVLDIKLGARLWADDAVPGKRDRLDKVSKETTSSSVGFRIAGMKVWLGQNREGEQTESILNSPGIEVPPTANDKVKSKAEIIEEDGYRRYDKWYGRAFNEHNVKQGFETFLAGAKTGKVDRSALIAKRLANELRSIQSMLEAEESRMYSASVLIVYEGDLEALEYSLDEDNKEKQEKTPESSPQAEEEPIMVGSIEPANILAGDESVKQFSISIDEEIPDLDDLEDEDEPNKVHDVRLIDFAHASWTPGQGPDENALQGVRSVARILEELAETVSS